MEKIEFYFLGLTFTLLALAIQTFKPTASLPADVVEVLGWIALLTSGLCGLSKVNGIPSALHLSERRSHFEQFKNELLKAKEGHIPVISPKDGNPVKIPEAMVATEQLIGGIKDAVENLGNRHNFKNTCQKHFFLIGLVALLLARAQGVIQRVVEHII